MTNRRKSQLKKACEEPKKMLSQLKKSKHLEKLKEAEIAVESKENKPTEEDEECGTGRVDVSESIPI